MDRGDKLYAIMTNKLVMRLCAYFWGAVLAGGLLTTLGICCIGLVQSLGWTLGTMTVLLTIVGVLSLFPALLYVLDD